MCIIPRSEGIVNRNGECRFAVKKAAPEGTTFSRVHERLCVSKDENMFPSPGDGTASYCVF